MTSDDLPYVVKSPWLYQVIDEVLAQPSIVIHGVIIPVRDLVEAATSRVVIELQALHRRTPWMADLGGTWENWAITPGGALVSLNSVDQARLLAVGFHHLIQRLVQSDIPIILLSFPRLVQDPDYLFRKLSHVLPSGVSMEAARAAHIRSADLTKVRMRSELADMRPPRKSGVPRLTPRTMNWPTHDEVDQIAICRELALVRSRLLQTEANLDHTRVALTDAQAENDQLKIRLSALEKEGERLRSASASLSAELVKQHQHALDAEALAKDAFAKLNSSLAEIDELSNKYSKSQIAVSALHSSTSWRITKPLRTIGAVVKPWLPFNSQWRELPALPGAGSGRLGKTGLRLSHRCLRNDPSAVRKPEAGHDRVRPGSDFTRSHGYHRRLS
ncbi:MAG: hypothetical protein JOY71_16050 [Acetobacteraceae bacterium]|nr:hypothetical protein [Acetobacteraceae bacterium]